MAEPIALQFRPILCPVTFDEIPCLSLKKFYREIIPSDDSLEICIAWLRQNGILASRMLCKCNSEMRIGQYTKVLDRTCFRCPEKNCQKIASIRAGSFFEGSNLPLTELLEFIYLWAKNLQSTDSIEENLGWSTHTITDWKNFMRDLCFERNISNPEPIGGPGCIVEIDESMFGRRKYHRGRQLSGQWVFGGVVRGTKDIFMISVEDRSSNTLIPLINRYITPGSVIMSDKWAAYNQINPGTFPHLTVNHSENFIDPISGAHTQTIETSWRHAKRKAPTTNPELLDTYLSEHCWRKKFGNNAFNNILAEIRCQYPVI